MSEWKSFLKARIAQEQGEDEDALKTFDKLLRSNPTDPHLHASRSFALERLGRNDEAASSRIASVYSALGANLVGEADNPREWTKGLQGLAKGIEGFEKSGNLSATFVAW
ncbi:hypothetical protein OG225_33580 [Nocardia sp. NBC_01377]